MIDARRKGKERRREKTVEGEMSHTMAWYMALNGPVLLLYGSVWLCMA